MDQLERINFEETLLPAFGKLKEKMGGTVHSMSPDFGAKEGSVGKEVNPNLIDEAKYTSSSKPTSCSRTWFLIHPEVLRHLIGLALRPRLMAIR